MESRTIPPPQASARQTEMGDVFNRVLFSAIDALQAGKIPYALIGGIAASGMGRPRSTHDIDIFVRPEDAESALESLGQAGFETERTDVRWLFKGWKEEMMVDIIFKSQGDIYLDTEMYQHAKPISYHGRNIPAVAPEDLIIIKAAVHAEVGPHHWHDALAILSHATVDWQYLLRRARRAPRRLLALLIYAQSNDILIPNQVIIDLYNVIFGQDQKVHTPSNLQASNAHSGSHSTTSGQSQGHPIHSAGRPMDFAPAQRSSARPSETSANTIKSTPSDVYLVGHLLERLATDARTAAADIQLSVGNKKILVKGDTATHAHRIAIEEVINDHVEGFEVDNQVRVTEIAEPNVEQVV